MKALNFHKNQSQPTLLYLFVWRFEQQVSACSGHHQAPLKKHELWNSTFQKGEGLPLHTGLKYTFHLLYLHMSYIYLFHFYLILYTYKTVYFNPLWSGRPSPFWKVEFQCSCFFRGAWWWPEQAETCCSNLQTKSLKKKALKYNNCVHLRTQ
jgi:hypothetical protein